MALTDQLVTDRFAIYCGDCIDGMRQLPDEKIHLTIYSLPFVGLYHYSSNELDLSNCRSYEEFFQHYEFVVREKHRITMPGRISAVHCMDVPSGNSGGDSLRDFPGDIIRLHERLGWSYIGRHCVWKEPLEVRNRTLRKDLAHKTVIVDSTLCSSAGADFLLLFRRSGKNPVPVTHDRGLLEYAGAREIPKELLRWRGFEGNQRENRYSQWVWRQYASAFWDDVRLHRVLPFRDSKEPDDEKHVHPLQLDAIERIIELRSNPGETVATPFMGVGSEVYAAVVNGRRGIGFELKETYFKQARLNVEAAAKGERREEKKQTELFAADFAATEPETP